jgi:hypothetical protein
MAELEAFMSLSHLAWIECCDEAAIRRALDEAGVAVAEADGIEGVEEEDLLASVGRPEPFLDPEASWEA